MISVNKALDYIKAIEPALHINVINLVDSLNLILAKDIYSPIDMPPFKQSAMDGYAIKLNENLTYHLIAESKAGDEIIRPLKEQEAFRIFTGAMLPDGADTVVAQEEVDISEPHIIIRSKTKKSANIRPIGEQVKKGDLVLKKGEKLTAASIGFLAGLGITKIPVYTPPKISIVVTGNELQEAGIPLKPGKIYESNAIMLEMALKKMGISEIKKFKTQDRLEETINIISEAMKYADILLISGGISVGDYDFVKDALLENKVKEIFYKVWQKPGKPLWFGKKEQKYIFALPGNPASALTSFYVYAYPLIKKMSGHKENHLPRVQAEVTSEFYNKNGKGLFLKAHLYENGKVDLLQGQQSSMLHSYAASNVLAYIPPHLKKVKKGDTIQCIKLDI